MTPPKRFLVWHRIDTDFGRASWCCDGQIVSVRTVYGSKSEIASGQRLDELADRLVRDLAIENGARVKRMSARRKDSLRS